MKRAWRGGVAAASAALGLFAAGGAHAQAMPKPPDLATQNAVADYNAGNLVAARSEFRRAAQRAAVSPNSTTR